MVLTATPTEPLDETCFKVRLVSERQQSETEVSYKMVCTSVKFYIPELDDYYRVESQPDNKLRSTDYSGYEPGVYYGKYPVALPENWTDLVADVISNRGSSLVIYI